MFYNYTTFSPNFANILLIHILGYEAHGPLHRSSIMSPAGHSLLRTPGYKNEFHPCDHILVSESVVCSHTLRSYHSNFDEVFMTALHGSLVRVHPTIWSVNPSLPLTFPLPPPRPTPDPPTTTFNQWTTLSLIIHRFVTWWHHPPVVT